MKEEGFFYLRTSVFSPGTTPRDTIKEMLAHVKATGDRCVAHCSGGSGRGGLVLAYWLVEGMYTYTCFLFCSLYSPKKLIGIK